MADSKNIKTESQETFQTPEAFAAFDIIISKGRMEKTVTLTEGVEVVIRPLTSQEQLTAETTRLATMYDVGNDTLDRFRGIQMMAYAIISINGAPVEPKHEARMALLNKLMSLPPTVINVLLAEYRTLIKEQAEVLGNNFAESIQNF